MNKLNWDEILTKVRFAAYTALAVNTVSILAALNGTLSWKAVGVGVVASVLPVVVAYLKPETEVVVIPKRELDEYDPSFGLDQE